jgi:PAS domain S-box-containing protein
MNPAPLVISAVAAGGLVAVAASLFAGPPALDPALLRKAIVLVAVTAVAEMIAIRMRHGDQSELITLYELAVVADLVLLPASAAVAVAMAGLGLALVLQRRRPVKIVFNLGSYGLGIVAATAVYHGLGGGSFSETRGLLGLAAGMAAFAGLNLLTISAILAATEGKPLARVIEEERGLSIAMGMGNSAVGIVAVSLYLTRPALLPAVLAPTLALHLAFRGWVKEKELSRRMEDEKAKLERIVEHSAEGIVLAEADGTVVLWSPSMEAITGVPAPEAIGKALAFLLRGRGHHGEPVSVGVLDRPEAVELEIVRADGAERWLRVQHGPALSPEGKLVSDVVVAYDMTRQHEVERMKDDFVSTVSHELRTPLTPIKGYASLLLRRGDDLGPQRRREALESIMERTDHMTRLVEDLLLASRMGRPGERRVPGDVKRVPVELVALAEKAMRPFRLSSPTREFILEAPEEATVVGDPLRVEQVLANLISNAVKFSEDGTAVVVTVGSEEGRGWVSVRDEGRGIPADKYEEIFEKFKRLEDSLRMETGGAGLGLFIVQQLVAAMGGEVRVESELGRGSTFTVWLPAQGAISPPRRRAEDFGQRSG